MNKTELIDAIAEKTGMTKAAAKEAVNAFADVVTDELKAGNKVQLVGFATFDVKERAERTGKNPQTGKPITIPATKVAHCKMAKILQ